MFESITETAQFWLMVYTFDTGRYLFGAGTVAIALFWMGTEFNDVYRIQSRRASGADIQREVGYSLLTTAVYATVALFTVKLERMGYITHYSCLSDYPLWYTALSLPLILIMHDAYFYWVHRFMHWKPVFRLFHRVHHRSFAPTPWAAYAFAPGEAFLMALIVPLYGFLLPLHELVLLAFLTIMILRNAMGHAGVEFHPRWWVDSPLDIFTTTTHHDLHHQRGRGNYGLYFTWWDRWMDTEFADYKERFREAASGNRLEGMTGASPGNTPGSESKSPTPSL